MKALVYHGPGKRAWEEKPKAALKESTDAVVRILRTTICGTDLHILMTLTVVLLLETWTAGASPKKFGSVKREASAIVSPISAYFQAGKRFTYLMLLMVPFGNRV